MSTHYSDCVVCGAQTSCAEDEHVLGCGDGGCYGDGPRIEFCSVACFLELRRRMNDREQVARELGYADWFEEETR